MCQTHLHRKQQDGPMGGGREDGKLGDNKKVGVEEHQIGEGFWGTRST